MTQPLVLPSSVPARISSSRRLSSGFIIKALREAGSEAPVLMVSALSDVDDRVSGLRAGGDDYLVKPFDPNELDRKSVV